MAALTASAPASRPSARRFAAAGLLSLLVPGAGHAVVGRRVAALVFLIPVVLLAVAALGYYLGGGEIKVLAFIVSPGVLPALAIVNIALWAERRSPRH